jgi:translation initiation factor IF-1
MTKENVITVNGEVSEVLPNVYFRIKVPNFPEEVLAYMSGKMRRHSIKIIAGDRVVLEFSPYDLTRGRIVRRL